jgi:hypothetical protein
MALAGPFAASTVVADGVLCLAAIGSQAAGVPHAPGKESRIRTTIPLSRRKIDLLPIAFFLVNVLFTIPLIDLEQVLIADPAERARARWPPDGMIDRVHAYGEAYDPLVMARPLWYRATLAWQAVLFWPFYVVAIYAFVRGRDWIRTPSLLWAGSQMTIVMLPTVHQVMGPHATDHLAVVLALYHPWIVVPLVVIARLWRSEHPFSEPAAEARPGSPT